jgi:hypothetical protein
MRRKHEGLRSAREQHQRERLHHQHCDFLQNP